MDDADGALFTFVVRGCDRLVVPGPAMPTRTDGLWATTCFEAFLRPPVGDAYQEYNFSPSGAWAAYGFTGNRRGMRELALVADPFIGRDEDADPDVCAWHVDLDLTHLPAGPFRLALSAVIEEVGGRKSYWALAHPPGAPDFHHLDCFAAELAPTT